MTKCPNCNKKTLRKTSVIYLDNGEMLFYSLCSCGFMWYVYDTKLWVNFWAYNKHKKQLIEDIE